MGKKIKGKSGAGDVTLACEDISSRAQKMVISLIDLEITVLNCGTSLKDPVVDDNTKGVVG